MDGLGIAHRWVLDISQQNTPVLGPTQPPVQWVPTIPVSKAPETSR